MESEKITIGITCFNAEDTIIRAIDSAINQTYPDFEIIIVDDFSTDQSVSVIEHYISDKKNIKLIKHQQNKGFPSALNTLVEHANGDYIAFFDDDDVSRSDRLIAQYERLKTFESISGTDKIFCYSNRAIVQANQKEVDHIALAIGRYAAEPVGEDVMDFILWHSHNRQAVWGVFGSCTLMVKTDFLKEIGFFDIHFRRSAEWDIAIRGAQLGAYFIAVNEPLITQYKTLSSDKGGRLPLKYALLLREKYKKYLVERGVYLTSISFAYYQYHRGKEHYLRSFLWMGAVCILSPYKVFFEKALHHFKAKKSISILSNHTFRQSQSYNKGLSNE